MNHIKRCAVAGQVKRFCNRFAQGSGSALGQVIPRQDLLRWAEEEAGDYRERIYSPLQTLALFIEQALGADQFTDSVATEFEAIKLDCGEIRSHRIRPLDTRHRVQIRLPSRCASWCWQCGVPRQFMVT
jgi:hypothetical protein